MKQLLRKFYNLDSSVRQSQVFFLIVALFFLGIFTDVGLTLFPFGLIRVGLGFLFFTFFAIHLYLLLKDRENIGQSARWIALVVSFFVFQWVGNFGSVMMTFPVEFFFSQGLFQIFVLGYGSVLVNQVIAEESENTPMKDPRYTPPIFRTQAQQNMDMTPKVHRVTPTDVSTTAPTSWYCPSCGEKVPQNTKRCPKCKEKIDF